MASAETVAFGEDFWAEKERLRKSVRKVCPTSLRPREGEGGNYRTIHDLSRAPVGYASASDISRTPISLSESSGNRGMGALSVQGFVKRCFHFHIIKQMFSKGKNKGKTARESKRKSPETVRIQCIGQ